MWTSVLRTAADRNINGAIQQLLAGMSRKSAEIRHSRLGKRLRKSGSESLPDTKNGKEEMLVGAYFSPTAEKNLTNVK
ncbi:MAG: hypothetical protein ACI8UO_003928 [Verrucomicrobiales bacterium]|jgi:hypothetical protein